jgi:hypothetical protein
VTVRRTVLVAAVVLGAFAPDAGAKGSAALDGAKKVHVRYTGSLSTPAMSADTLRSDSLTPSRSDCTKDSCDTTSLRLTLPKGSVEGRFQVSVATGRNLNVMIGLYDARNRLVSSADVSSKDSQPYSCCDTIGDGYAVVLRVARLRAGRYTVVVFDRGGLGDFTADVDYHAHPPNRPLPKR